MEAIHDAKSHDYATDDNPYSNFDFAKIVLAGFKNPHDQPYVTMVSVKLARLSELLGRGKTPKHESVEDTFLDLANYVVLWWTSYQRLADNPARDEGVDADELYTFEDLKASAHDIAQIRQQLRMLKDREAPPTRSQLEAQAAAAPSLMAYAFNSLTPYLNDGAGQRWLRCGPTCDLRMTHPGQVTCRCHGSSDDTA